MRSPTRILSCILCVLCISVYENSIPLAGYKLSSLHQLLENTNIYHEATITTHHIRHNRDTTYSNNDNEHGISISDESMQPTIMQKDYLDQSILTNRERLKIKQEQEDLIELEKYFKDDNTGRLSLPAPTNVTIILLSWYPPVLRLNWWLTELDGHHPAVIDYRKSTFVETDSQANETSTARSTAAKQTDDISLDDDDADDSDLEGDELQRTTTSSAFIINIDDVNSGDNNNNSSNVSRTTTTSSNPNNNNNHNDNESYEKNDFQTAATTTRTDTSYTYQFVPSGASPHKQLAKRKKQLLKRALSAFQVTYNAVDSRFKTVEEYPPYLRSITLERLAPATRYELKVSAIYIGANKNTSQRVQFISPSDNESRRFRENSYRPIHRYPDEPTTPYKIRGEEITIVIIVIIFWIATVYLFINKWGKIRMLEPYQPAYREAPLFHHSSIHGPPTKGMSFCGGVATTQSVMGASVPVGPGGSLNTSGPIFFTTTGQSGLPSRASSQAGPERSSVGYDLSTIGKQSSTGGYSGLRSHHHYPSLFATKAHAIAKASCLLDQSNWRYANSRERVPSLVGSGGPDQIARAKKSICAASAPRMRSIDAGIYHRSPQQKTNFRQQRMVKMGSSTASGQSIEQHQLDMSQNRQRRLLFLSQKEQGSGCQQDHHQRQSPNGSFSSMSIPSMPQTRTNSDEKKEKIPTVGQQQHHILIEPPSPPKLTTNSTTCSRSGSKDERLIANRESGNQERDLTSTTDEQTPEPFTISKSGPSTVFGINLNKIKQTDAEDVHNIPRYYSSSINLQHNHHQSNVTSSHLHYKKHRPYSTFNERDHHHHHYRHPHPHNSCCQQQQYCSHQQLPYSHNLVQHQQQSTMIVEQQNDDILQCPSLFEVTHMDDTEICDRNKQVYSADCTGHEQFFNYSDDGGDQSMSDTSKLMPSTIRHDTQSSGSVPFYQQQQHDQSLLLDTNDAYLTSRGGTHRPRLSSVFVAGPYARTHRDSFAMLRAISQKKSKSAEDVACLSSLVLQIWNKDRNPLLQLASASINNTSKDTDNEQGGSASRAKRRRPRSSLTVAHL